MSAHNRRVEAASSTMILRILSCVSVAVFVSCPGWSIAQLLVTVPEGTSDTRLDFVSLPALNSRTIGGIRVGGALPLGISAIAADESRGVVWAVSGKGSFFYPSSLFRVSQTNGSATLIGRVGDVAISGLAVANNGRLYGWNSDTGLPIEIDTETGAARVIGSLPFVPQTLGGGLASDPTTGLLYVSSSGAQGALRTFVAGTTSFSTIANITGTPFNTTIRSLAFRTGVLYGLNTNSDFTNPPILVTLNTATAVSTTVGALPLSASGLSAALNAGTPGVFAAPSNLACAPANRRINCQWAVPETGGPELQQTFKLSCAASQPPYSISSTASTTRSATVSGLRGSVMQYCAVSSVNAFGEGPTGPLVTVTPYSSLATDGSADINGDGRNEVLTSGGPGVFQMGVFDKDARIFRFFPKPYAGLDWRVLGTGDFAPTFRSALVIQDSLGNVRFCFDSDCGPDSTPFVRSVRLAWRLEAVADFDGDGRSDLLWRYGLEGSPDAGAMFIWFMNGSRIDAILPRGGAPLSWRIVGAADFDGDGQADLVAQSPSGELRVLAAGANRSFTNRRVGQMPVGFGALKVADYDGDGRADVLLHNPATGQLLLWISEAGGGYRSVSLPDISPTWTFYASGDYDGDGTFDIVWRRDDGSLVTYLSNQTDLRNPTIINNSGVAPTNARVIMP